MSSNEVMDSVSSLNQVQYRARNDRRDRCHSRSFIFIPVLPVIPASLLSFLRLYCHSRSFIVIPAKAGIHPDQHNKLYIPK
jgi:hypothetical protein